MKLVFTNQEVAMLMAEALVNKGMAIDLDQPVSLEVQTTRSPDKSDSFELDAALSGFTLSMPKAAAKSEPEVEDKPAAKAPAKKSITRKPKTTTKPVEEEKTPEPEEEPDIIEDDAPVHTAEDEAAAQEAEQVEEEESDPEPVEDKPKQKRNLFKKKVD